MRRRPYTLIEAETVLGVSHSTASYHADQGHFGKISVELVDNRPVKLISAAGMRRFLAAFSRGPGGRWRVKR